MDLDLEKFRELVDKRSGNRTFAIGGVTFRSSLALSKQQKAEVRRVVKKYRALERDPDHDVDMWEGADLSREILTAAAEDKQKAKALIDGFDDREVDGRHVAHHAGPEAVRAPGGFCLAERHLVTGAGLVVVPHGG